MIILWTTNSVSMTRMLQGLWAQAALRIEVAAIVIGDGDWKLLQEPKTRRKKKGEKRKVKSEK